MTKKIFPVSMLTFMIAALAVSITATNASAQSVSFLVDPADFDSNSDGFITDSEFQPVASDGTIFSFVPTDNLTGTDRFLLDPDSGLQFGGGGGSTLSFEFTVDRDITLESYSLADSGIFLSNPTFNITEGATVLSSTNTSTPSGATIDFNGGPIDLTAGTTYMFDAQITGAAVSSNLAAFNFSAAAVPEPSSTSLVSAFATLMLARRRKRN